MAKISLYGASGHARVIIDILKANGENVHKLVDDNIHITALGNNEVIHTPEGLSTFIISIGNNRIRKSIAERLACNYAKAIHPKAIVSDSASIGDGSVVMPGATINAGTVIGNHCIINTNSSIDHECVIGDYVHISPNAALCGNVIVGEGTHIGVGASIIPGVRIGKWATIGAGATVINNIPDGTTVVGTPAKIIKIDNKI